MQNAKPAFTIAILLLISIRDPTQLSAQATTPVGLVLKLDDSDTVATPYAPTEAKENDYYFNTTADLLPKPPASYPSYIRKNLKYPAKAKARRVQGVVYVQSVIDTVGYFRNVVITKGLSPECNAEAIRVIKAMPSWAPGQKQGPVIPVRVTIPVRFNL